MKNFKRILLFLGLATSLVACQKENVERKPHENKPEINFNDPDADPEVLAQATGLIKSHYEKRKDYWAMLNKEGNSFDDLYKKILQPLSPIILENTYFYSTKWRVSDELGDLLTIFNTAFAQALKSIEGKQKDPSQLSDLQARYMKIQFFGCLTKNFGLDISRGCQNISVFAKDPANVKVLVALSERKSQEVLNLRKQFATLRKADKTCQKKACQDLKGNYLAQSQEFFVLLKTAYMNKSNFNNEKLNILWQRHMDENFQLYVSGAKGQMDQWQQKVYCQIFSANLNSLDLSKNTSPEQNEEYLKLLDRFKPYSSESAEAFCIEDVDKLKADWFRYRLFDGGILDPKGTLVDYIALSQQVRPNLDQLTQLNSQALNHSEKIEVLRKNRYIYDSLELKTPTLDVYFYLVDELFKGQLKTEMASVIWDVLDKNQKMKSTSEKVERLYQTVNQYLRVEIAYMSLMTNLHFQDFFQTREFSSKDIFPGFLAHASTLKSDWRGIKDNADRILIFLEDSIESKFVKKFGPDFEEFQRQKIALKGMKSEINYVSVWPHMMMLSYFLARFEGTVEVFIWWLGKKVNLDLSSLIVNLLEGQLGSPWFDYGDPTQGLSKYQVIHAFDFWVRTDVMASYKNVAENVDGESVSLVNEDVFFDLLLEKYLFKDKKEFEDASKGLSSISDSVFDDLYKRCYAGAGPTQFIDPEEFATFTYLDIKESSMDKIIKGFTKSGGNSISLSDMVDKARSEFSSKIKLMNSFLAVLKHYRSHPPVNLDRITDENLKNREIERRAKINSGIEKMEARLGELVQIRNEFLKRAYDFQEKTFRNGQNCFKFISEEEQRRRLAFMDRELEYQRDIHAALTLVQIKRSANLSWEQVQNEIVRNIGVPQKEQSDVLKRVKVIFEAMIENKVVAGQEEKFINEMMIVNNESSFRRIDAGVLTYQDSSSGATRSYSWTGLEHLSPGLERSAGDTFAAEYRRHPADTLMRMRFFAGNTFTSLSGKSFAPVAKNLNVQMLSDFPKWGMLGVAPDLTVYQPSQTLFVQQAMTKVNSENGSYLDWFKPLERGFSASAQGGSGEFLISFQLNLENALMKWGEIPSGSLESCSGEEDSCLRIGSDRVLNVYSDLMEVMNLSSHERSILEWLNLNGNHGISQINTFFIAGTESNSTIYKKMFEEIYDFRKDKFYTEIRSIYQDENSLFRPQMNGDLRFDYSIFPFSRHVVDAVRAQYRPPIMKFFGQVFELINEIHKIEKLHKNDPVEMYLERVGDVRTVSGDVIKVDKGWKVLVPQTRGDGSPIYLGTLSLRNFQDSFVEFFTDTKCALLPTAAELKDAGIPLKESDLAGIPGCRAKASRLFQAWSSK